MKIPSLQRARQTSPHAYGMGMIVSAGLFFSVMALAVRLSKEFFRSDTLVFYRSLIQTLILAPWAASYFRGGLKNKFRTHVPRGVFGVAAMFCVYRALHLLPMALAYILAMTSVLWATLLARVFLQEKLTRRQLVSGGICCLGVALALLGADRGAGPWRLDWLGVAAGLGSGLCMGGAQVILRRMRGREELDSGEIVFYFGLTGLLWTTPLFLTHPQLPLEARAVSLLLLMGGTAAVAQLLFTGGFRYTNTMSASVANIAQMIPTLGLGFIVLGEKPPPVFLLGATLMAAGLFVLSKRSTPLSTS